MSEHVNGSAVMIKFTFPTAAKILQILMKHEERDHTRIKWIIEKERLQFLFNNTEIIYTICQQHLYTN